MEMTKSTISLFLEMQDLARLGFVTITHDDTVLVPTQVILEASVKAGGSVTWVKNGLYTTISMAECTWMLAILRKYAIDTRLMSLSKGDQWNIARALIFSPQIHFLSNGTQESTGMLLSVESIILSGGEAIRVFVKRAEIKSAPSL